MDSNTVTNFFLILTPSGKSSILIGCLQGLDNLHQRPLHVYILFLARYKQGIPSTFLSILRFSLIFFKTVLIIQFTMQRRQTVTYRILQCVNFPCIEDFLSCSFVEQQKCHQVFACAIPSGGSPHPFAETANQSQALGMFKNIINCFGSDAVKDTKNDLYDPFNSNEWRETKVMYVGISDKIAHFLDSQIATNNSPGIKI